MSLWSGVMQAKNASANFSERRQETVLKVPEMPETWTHGAPFGPF